MSELEQAQQRFDKADHMYRVGLMVFVIFIMLLFAAVMIQLYSVQRQIAVNQTNNAASSEARFKRYTDDNAAQHAKTQQYIRCIAETLTIPIADRTTQSFDQCSKP